MLDLLYREVLSSESHENEGPTQCEEVWRCKRARWHEKEDVVPTGEAEVRDEESWTRIAVARNGCPILS